MKKCSKCKVEKKEEMFSRDKTTKDGLSFSCKACKNAQRRESRLKNPEHYKEQQRKNIQKNYDSIRASQKKHIEENKEEICKRRRKNYWENREEILKKENARRKTPEFLEYARKYQQKIRDEKKEQTQAWIKVHRALEKGEIKKKTSCELCKSKINIEGHHEDYNKPLEVIWLCSKCHKGIHRIKKVKNA